MSKFVRNCGREYTIALSAEYVVALENAESMWEAEDDAWHILEQSLRVSDANEYEVYETLDINPRLISGYRVKVKVNYVIYVVGHDIDDAHNDAVELVENISMPGEVTLLGTEQTDLVEVGERVLMVVND